MKFAFLSCILAQLASAAMAAAPEPSPALHVVVYADVLASAAPRAAAALRAYRAASRREPGASGIDVYEQEGRASGFAIVEVWRESAAFETHSKAAAIERLRGELKPLQLAPLDVRVHTGFSVGPAAALGPHPITLLVHVDVLPPFVADYERILKRYTEGTRAETGLRRLDILQTLPPHTNHFTVVESWIDAAAWQAHQKAATAQTYREGLAPMLGALYDERAYRQLD